MREEVCFTQIDIIRCRGAGERGGGGEKKTNKEGVGRKTWGMRGVTKKRTIQETTKDKKKKGNTSQAGCFKLGGGTSLIPTQRQTLERAGSGWGKGKTVWEKKIKTMLG